jgi:translation initiation factor IF-2
MRARGCQRQDFAILVVATLMGCCTDARGHQPRKRARRCPLSFALNKMDLPSANPVRVKQAAGG